MLKYTLYSELNLQVLQISNSIWTQPSLSINYLSQQKLSLGRLWFTASSLHLTIKSRLFSICLIHLT